MGSMSGIFFDCFFRNEKYHHLFAAIAESNANIENRIPPVIKAIAHPIGPQEESQTVALAAQAVMAPVIAEPHRSDQSDHPN